MFKMYYARFFSLRSKHDFTSNHFLPECYSVPGPLGATPFQTSPTNHSTQRLHRDCLVSGGRRGAILQLMLHRYCTVYHSNEPSFPDGVRLRLGRRALSYASATSSVVALVPGRILNMEHWEVALKCTSMAITVFPLCKASLACCCGQLHEASNSWL